MDPDEARAAAERVRQAFDLFEAGVSMKRAQLRRQHPGASSEAIERMVADWLRTRPGAEHGDAVGRPRPLGPSGG